LGIWITDDASNATLLCAPRIARTKKFVSALAAAPAVVSSKYIDYCLKHHNLPDPKKFPLVDKEGEERFGINLQETIERAHKNKRKLLKDFTIFCSPNVTGGYDTYSSIVAANGGQCQLYKGRTNMTVSKRKISNPSAAALAEAEPQSTGDEKDDMYLISEAKQSEVHNWQKFRELAENVNMIPRIVSTEWLLTTAMAQELRFDESWELNEEKLKKDKRGK
jgi:hypothetical protein